MWLLEVVVVVVLEMLEGDADSVSPGGSDEGNGGGECSANTGGGDIDVIAWTQVERGILPVAFTKKRTQESQTWQVRIDRQRNPITQQVTT